ncbi:fibroblast growth factor receptor-like [Ptychodera flava]|uniref:fibroblast growth factor receptor-like n=1 Tax=Ptychodera flava TaxID=63121 RepID=UPI00396AA5ED
MRSLTDNENIVSCLKELTTEVPLRFVQEYCHYGNLKSYLKKLDREATEMRELLLFSLDCAKGMCFLAEMQCVHRQLSARVVMVDGQKTCKISELGFSTAVMDQETYERMNKGTLPIRWMALESIDECLYTSATDVWSYGILLWEIFSFGINPYRGMNLKDVVSNVQQGYRLPMPNKCPEDVYSIMQKCWQEDPSCRPTFYDLVELLETSDTSTAGIQRLT